MLFETFAKRLGHGIAAIRQTKEMTQAQLAREADISLKYLSMIESGTNPSVKTIMKVCGALDTDIAEVMEREGLGEMPGRKPAKLRGVQLDMPTDEPQMKQLLVFLRRLDESDRRRALRLITTTFGKR